MNDKKKTKTSSNKFRGKTFGVVINSLLNGESVEWKGLNTEDIDVKLNKLQFITKTELSYALNNLMIENTHKNLTDLEDFEGQLEFGTETNIPHYQLAIKSATVCTRPKVLEALQNTVKGFISVEIQHNFENMKDYCTKETEFISDKYSGRIFKKQWKESFLDKKPNLKNIIENPYPWQKLLKNQLLIKEPDDRIVDW